MKKIKWFVLVVSFILVNTIVTVVSFQRIGKQIIPTNYIAVFRGESADIVHSTYLYEKNNGKNKKYNYINTLTTFNGYDSTVWKEKVLKKGKIKEKNNILEIAQNNSAYDYVKYKNNQFYTIEEFTNFLMRQGD